MRSRRKWLCLLLAGIVAGVAWNLTREREPVYAGKSLSEWLLGKSNVNVIGTPRPLAGKEGIRQIGTNGIPYLLSWMSYHSPPWRAQAADFVARRLPGPLYSQWIVTTIAGYREISLSIAAHDAFAVLGPIAAPAIPELRDIAMKGSHMETRIAAVKALQAIGSDATPALIAIYTAPPDPMSALIVHSVIVGESRATNHSKSWFFGITNYFKHSDPVVRQGATNFAKDYAPWFLTNPVSR